MATYNLDGTKKVRPAAKEKTEAQKKAVKDRMAAKPKPHVLQRFAQLQSEKKI